MIYLITGGAGFIGSHLAEKLLGQGDEVIVLDDFSAGRWENLAEIPDKKWLRVVEEDVRGKAVDELVAEADTVFHLAAVVGVEQVVREPRRTMSVTVEGGANVLASCVRHRKPLLITSTSEVYGDNPNQPLRESYDLHVGPPSTPRWSYAAAKLLEEHMAMAEVRASKLRAVVVRLFNTVGPRQTGRYGMVVPRFVEAALSGIPLPIYGNGRQTRSFCDVRDVVSAIANLIGEEQAWGRVINIGAAYELSIANLAKLVLRTLGREGSARIANTEKRRGIAREIRRRVPDTTMVDSILGEWRLYPLSQTIQAVAKYILAKSDGEKAALP